MGMDELNEQTPSTETVDVNTTEQQTAESTATPVQQQETEQVREQKQNNWSNGQRRIQQRQSLKARVKELEARLAEYEGKDDDYSKFQSQQLQDRIDDMNAISADAEANDFADHASQFFGDETPAFMSNVYRYARYVNANEPDLLRYTQREYGPILLHEWMQRMDNPQLRAQWLQMTAYEKGRVLDNFYKQIGQVISQYGKGQAPAPGQTAKQLQTSVPVPNGGRQSPGAPATDDFGIALGQAFNRHKG
jgi:hypothetical protein